MEYFLSAIWAALELVALHFFWDALLEVKLPKKTYLLTFFLAWIATLIYLSIDLPNIFEQAISLAMLSVVICFCYRGSFFRKSLCVILYFISVAIIDTAIVYGTSAVLGISLSELVWRKVTYSLVVTIGKLIVIFLAWLVHYFRRTRAPEAIRQKWLLLTIPFPAVSLGMLAVVFYSNREKGDISIGVLLFCIMLAVANIAIIYLIDLMEKNTAESKKLALLNQRMEIQTAGIMALEKNYRVQRKATHEYRNQLQTIHDLLTAENKDVALSYIQQLQGMQKTRIFTVNSHHPVIDAVLNQKYQQAQEYDIDVQMHASDLSCVSIPADHLVVLLSNLLDNAIEACLHLPDQRIIQCSIILTDSLYISVRNTSRSVEINGNFIPTTKEPKEDHGYGLPHIDFILKQLHAEYVLSYQNGWFEFAAEIPQT